MKNLYWRPQRISRIALVLITLGALLGLVAVEEFKHVERKPHYDVKLQAARLAKRAFDVLREERLERRIPIEPHNDPADTGLIGSLMTEVTTNYGSLSSKRTAANPNFAAVMVHFFKKIGLEAGDVVAIGYSGSFPAINVATMAAIEAMKLEPIVVSSASSSQWGANELGFLWLDMEKELFDRGVFSHRSVAASIGGIEDRGRGLPKKGMRDLRRSIEKNDVEFLESETFSDAVEQRMQLYYALAGAKPITAYVNVGGGTISVGRKIGKQMFESGLNTEAPPGALAIDSVMARFITTDVPVIHMSGIKKIAAEFGLEIEPLIMPPVGQGDIFAEEAYNRWLIGVLLVMILLALYLLTRSDIAVRLARPKGPSSNTSRYPEPMV